MHYDDRKAEMMDQLTRLTDHLCDLHETNDWPLDKPKNEYIVHLLHTTFARRFAGDITWGLTRPPPPVVPPKAGGDPMHPTRMVQDHSVKHNVQNEGELPMVPWKDTEVAMQWDQAPPLEDLQAPMQQC